MKKLYNIILASFALLAFVPAVYALDDDPPYVDDGSGICYSKTISEPTSDGVYTITLESFVTGSVTIKNESIPADIVLVLDVSGSMSENNKLANLKTAVKAFIDEIHRNDLYDKEGNRRKSPKTQNDTTLGNQISIVKFAMNYYSGNSATITPGDTYGNASGTSKGTYQASSGSGWNYNEGRPYNATQVRVGFTRTDTDANVTTLKNAVDGLRAGGATAADYGMNLARLLLNNLPSDRAGSARTVVFFTDGSPTYQTNFDNTVANNAISYSRQIKQSGSETHPQVFSVGVFDNSPTSGSNIDRFMNHISSNYPNATGVAANASGTKESDKFYTDASSGSVDLTEVFQTIAQASGGSDKDLGTQTVSNVDIVSASFTLPPNTDASKIKLYTAKYLGTKVDGYLQFGPKMLKGTNPDKYRKREKDDEGHIQFVGDSILVDAGLTANVSASVSGGKNDRITVNGFDYANLFCGEDDLRPDPGYNGYKVIIEIPIMMDPEAVGGPDVSTNAPGSGIYVGDEPICTFESPKVSLPVNLHIRKEGLLEGESAKFTIQRKYVKDSDAQISGNPWIDVSSVFVTRHKDDAQYGENAPVTKVQGMPSVDEDDKPFVYQILEDNWGWSYTSRAATPTTSDQLVTNPFIFVNTKQQDIETLVKHAESKATNVFKTGVKNVTYDDSKKNTGTGRD